MALPNGNPLSAPRYRVEEHAPDLAALIVGFADTPSEYWVLLADRDCRDAYRADTD